jgi:hypothetical protein
MNQENDTTAQDVETVREALKATWEWDTHDPSRAALDRLTARIATLTEGLRHVVPGNGGMMEVTCEDYDSFVAHSLADIRARAEQAERERDAAIAELRLDHPEDVRTGVECSACRFLHARSTEGEPAGDRCPKCGSASRRVVGVSYNPFAGEQMACGNAWHTTPKEDR